MSELTRYTNWTDPKGEWVRASEAEAALAERDERIRRGIDKYNRVDEELEVMDQRIAELEARLELRRQLDDEARDRIRAIRKAADALADAVKRWRDYDASTIAEMTAHWTQVMVALDGYDKAEGRSLAAADEAESKGDTHE